MCELFVVFFQSADMGGAFSQFVNSQDEFDQRLKGQVLDTASDDLNAPPPGSLSDVISVYEGALAPTVR